MSIRQLLVCLCVLVTSVTSEAKWDLVQKEVTAFDIQPNGVGLLGISPTAPYLAKKTPTNLVGVLALTSPINDIGIVDENLAFMSVKDSGTYIGTDKWEKWSKLDTFTSSKFLLTEPFATIIQTTTTTRFFYQGRFYNVDGTIEPFYGVDYTNDTVLYAVSATHLYRSNDRGRNWQEMVGSLPAGAGRSIYIDRARNLIYVGGQSLHVSSDRGQSWRKIATTSSGDPTTGAVYGTPDCTGAFYIVSSSQPRPEILISRSQGEFLQEVGYNPVAIYSVPLKMQVYNKGNNVYWLDQSMGLYYSPDGVDGSALDSASLYVDLEAEKNVVLRICREQNVAVGLEFTNSDCIPIIVDSIRQTKGKGKLFAPLGSFTVAATAVDRPLNYVSTVVGWDTIRMRAYMHSSQGTKPEYRDFIVIVRTLTDPPDMALNLTDLQYGEVKVAKEKPLNIMITNNGCDSLRVDSIKSSWPEIFTIVSTRTTPFKLGKGAQHTFQVVFKPGEEGPFLEAIEIGTNGGHDFISVYGIGTVAADVSTEEQLTYRYFPNPFRDEITIENVQIGSTISVYDMLGNLMQRSVAAQPDLTLPLSALPVGSYILQVGDRRSKLIKQ